MDVIVLYSTVRYNEAEEERGKWRTRRDSRTKGNMFAIADDSNVKANNVLVESGILVRTKPQIGTPKV